MPERTRLKIQWNPPVFGCEEFYAARKYFRNPAVPVRVFRAGHAGTVMHAHDFMELALVTSGSARYEFCSAAGVRRGCELMAGDLIGLAPGDRHCYSEGEAFTLCNILFQPEFLGGSWPELAELAGMKRLLRGESIHLNPARQAEAAALLDRINDEMWHAPVAMELAVRSLLTGFLLLAGRSGEAAPASIVEETETRDGVSRAIVYMEQHFARRIELARLAECARLSPTYFCSSFHAATGMTPWEYLIRLRLEKAKQLLRNSDFTVSEIAQRTGFCDASYLTRLFRRHEKMTPRRYAERGREWETPPRCPPGAEEKPNS